MNLFGFSLKMGSTKASWGLQENGKGIVMEPERFFCPVNTGLDVAEPVTTSFLVRVDTKTGLAD